MHLDAHKVSPAIAYERLAAAEPNRPSVTVLQRSWTRADINGFAARTASRLQQLGVGPGDRVAIVRRNAALHLLAVLSVARLGAVLVPVNFRLSPAESATILRDCGAKVVICGPRHSAAFDAEIDKFAPAVWVVDDMDETTDPVPEHLSDRWHVFSGLPGGELDRPWPTPVQIGGDDLLMLQYTSGSTGAPKGVRMTYRNVWTSWKNFADTVPASAFDATLAVAPFGHVGGLNSFTLQTLMYGGTVVVQRQFDVGHALELVERERVRSIFGVPVMYEAMSRHPDFSTRDLSSLEVAMIGGSSAFPDLLGRYVDRGVPMYHSWGMTETLGLGTVLLPEDYPQRPRSIGRPAPHVELKIVDRGGATLGEGAVGELCIRGDSVSDGYWGRPKMPEDGFLPDGWFATGDLAQRDAEGYYTLRGRAKDVIISGGENIFPAEVEREIRVLPEIAEVAVVGVPDSRWGETPLAFVVAAPGATAPSLEDLRARLDGAIARYKLPRHLHVLEAMPVGSTGKIDRAVLSAWALDSHHPGRPWFTDSGTEGAVAADGVTRTDHGEGRPRSADIPTRSSTEEP